MRYVYEQIEDYAPETIAGEHAIFLETNDGGRETVAFARSAEDAEAMVDLMNMGLDSRPAMSIVDLIDVPLPIECVINAPALADERVIGQVPILN